RGLRPGGRGVLCVDSLTLGRARRAERNCWAHLPDVPSAEVVVIPGPDGTITRAVAAHQLRQLPGDGGLEVDSTRPPPARPPSAAGLQGQPSRPRPLPSPSTVEPALAASPKALSRLVRTELTPTQTDESLGTHPLASARKK